MKGARICVPATRKCPGDALVAALENQGRREHRMHQSHPRLACKRKRHRYAEASALPAQWFYGLYAISPEYRAC